MLEIKKSYEELANMIPAWKKKTVCDLANKYLELKDSNDNLADSYLSAIILKYWYLVNSNYNKQIFKNASQEDCYAWVVDGIMYVLKNHVWTDPENSLYNDPSGPEKAINVVIYTKKQQFYNFIKKQKRMVNYNKVSLTDLESDSGDSGWVTPVNDKYCFSEDYFVQLVKNYFEQKNYSAAFIIDAIINLNMFIDDDEGTYFSERKLKHHLRNLDKNYCKLFSNCYNLDYNTVCSSLKYVTNVDDFRFSVNFKRLLLELKNNKDLMEILQPV